MRKIHVIVLNAGRKKWQQEYITEANAVPPLLAKAIADQIAEGFGLTSIEAEVTVMGNTNSVVWRLYFYLHGGKYRCTGRDFFNWLPAIP